ncbi:MAG: DNA recombination protein RmuC [Gammaproteobacteria bacterium]
MIYLIACGIAGLIVGVLSGFGLSRLRNIKLQHELDLRETEIKNQGSLDAEREQALALATERLSTTFGQLANEQLQSHTETFLKLARESLGTHHERAKAELAAREQAVEHLVRPIRDSLSRTEAQINALEKTRHEAHGSITAQLEAMAAGQQTLSAETRNLVNALRRPEVRGQWGEITLKRVVELAGMVEHCDFVTQSHTTTEDGAIRPDMIINMPDRRQVVVDVKTPLDAYLDAIQAEDEAAQATALERHGANVAKRVRELASKTYWAQFEDSPEFVILFIPGDQFLSAALAQRPDLLDDALRQQVIIATPTSFVALLKAIAYGWQQTALTENAAEIRGLAVQLYERLNTFAGHISTMGKELGNSVKAYNQAVGSLEHRVLPSVRRFTELGVNPKQRLETVKPVDETPRELAAGSTDGNDSVTPGEKH